MSQQDATKVAADLSGHGRTQPRQEDWSRGLRERPSAPPLGLRVLLASLTINILTLGLPVVLLQVYDRILPNQSSQTLLLLIGGLVVVLVLDSILRLARSSITGWSAARFEHLLSCRAVDRMLAARIDDFERDAPGVHLDRFNAIDSLRDFNAGQARLLAVDLPFVVIFIGLIALIAGWLALVPLGLLCLLAISAAFVGRLLRGALEQRYQLDDRRYNFMIEVLSSILTVKGLAMEPLLLRRYEKLQESGAASTYRCTFFAALAQNIGAIFSNLTMMAVASAGVLGVIEGSITIGSLAACTLLAGRSIQPLLRALGLWAQFQSIRVAKQRLDRLFALEPETRAEGGLALPLAGALALEEVSFGYEGEAPLFDRVSLQLAPGEIVGVRGGTGSGKSTLLMLILAALKPDSGRILIDGRELGDYDLAALRRQIAYLPQDAVLFQGSILENLTMFGGPEKLEPALAASKLLGLHGLIRRLPAGYDTLVGDGANDELPTGVRQGIVLARALVGQPRIILFDEANSALDSKSDKVLKEALASMKGGPSMVLVSHRPSLLALADRVYDIADAKLVLRPPAPPKAEATAEAPAISRAEPPVEAEAAKLVAGGGARAPLFDLTRPSPPGLSPARAQQAALTAALQ